MCRMGGVVGGEEWKGGVFQEFDLLRTKVLQFHYPFAFNVNAG